MSVGWAARLRALTRRPFVRNVVFVGVGTTVAQVITVLVAPITSRQYGPNAYGVANVFISTVSILASLGGLSYGLAIVLPERDEDALALMGLSVRIAVAASALLALVFLLAGDLLADLMGLTDFWMLLVVAPVVFFSGLSLVFTQWLMRRKRFKCMGALEATQSLTQNGARVGIGFVAPGAAALVGVVAVGTAFYAAMAYVASRASLREARDATAPADRRAPRRAVARRYRDFPLYREPQVLLNSVSGNLPVILLAAFFDPVVAGLYGLALNVLGLPGTLVAGSVGKVFLPHAAETVRDGGDLRRSLLRVTGVLALAGIVPFGIVVVAGPWLFATIFGQEWAVAGEYARWLSLWLYAGFVNVPSVQVIPILGLQRGFLLFEIAVSVSRIVAVVAGALALGSALASIVLFSLVGLAASVVLIAAVIGSSGTRRRESF